MSQEEAHNQEEDTLFSPFEEALVQTPVEEFRAFCKSRIGGLELTEDETSLEAYRLAYDLGMRTLKGEVEESNPDEGDAS